MLEYFLSDNESLSQYLTSNFVSFTDIKRRLFLKAREQNVQVPDHIYRLEQETIFNSISSLGDLFSLGIPALASRFLATDGVKIVVDPAKQNSWQQLLTYFSPLFLQSVFIQKVREKERIIERRELVAFFKTFILPNTLFTSIPCPKIIQLDNLVINRHGLYDLHMHLNGALETDQVWQDFLNNPQHIYKSLKKGFTNPKVREQLEQESRLLYPLTYVSILKVAQRLRQFFYDYLFDRAKSLGCKTEKEVFSAVLNSHRSKIPGSRYHPFVSLISSDGNYPHLMAVECMMYILILREIKQRPNKLLESMFHFYLLILGLTNRLLVQQVHQNGFEQFQKHTLNELREVSERTYFRRYHQMNGNKLSNIGFLEGRFSPKGSMKEMVTFIDQIYKGWERMRGDIKKIVPSAIQTDPDLKLVAHFIKKADNRPDASIRHKALRYELFQKARVLALLRKNFPKYRSVLCGVDAAASEFDARPEVFAPVFRYLRRSGVKHFTFHAGEDFFHILDGLRAIYEAMIFCDLQNGDRIGHATAAGLSVKLWRSRIGDSLFIRQGEHLDNLVFAYDQIVNGKIDALNILLPSIVNEINDLTFCIYNKYYPISILRNAWLLRQYCPFHSLATSRASVSQKLIYNSDEWRFWYENGFIGKSGTPSQDEAVHILQFYHDYRHRYNFDKIIKIKPFGIFDEQQLEILQLNLLDQMSRKEIVIETLPTSNVRIGFHADFSSYHLCNWIGWREDGKNIPPIVVGTDDTGIFATNIYNEYANIYSLLVNAKRKSPVDAMKIIESFDENSRIYAFK